MDILLSAMAKAGDGPSGMNSAQFHHFFDEDAAKLGIEETIGDEGSDFRQMDETFFDAEFVKENGGGNNGMISFAQCHSGFGIGCGWQLLPALLIIIVFHHFLIVQHLLEHLGQCAKHL